MEYSADIYNAGETVTDISKCPGCGSNLEYNPEKEVLCCQHCGTEQTFDKQNAAEQNFEKLFDSQQNAWGNETRVFSCQNCGAKEILSKEDISKTCSFCGTTNVVETNELSGLKPNAVVPFKITKETAGECVTKWARKKLFAPKSFRQSAAPEEISALYNPAFTFDTNTFSTYKGKLGRRKSVTRRVNGRTVTETRIEYFYVSGTFSHFFDDILIQASTVVNQKDLAKLAPFDTKNSNNYTKEFMHGYTATQYTKDGKACWKDAKKVIDAELKKKILSKYSYDTVAYLNINTSCNNITYKYLLLPLYVGHCSFRQKLYNFFVNGRNGKVAGKTPVSPLKVGLAVLAGIAVIAGIGLLVYFMGGA